MLKDGNGKADLNPEKVPPALRPFIQYANKWGIADDFEREDALKAASREELEELVAALSTVNDDIFDEWLAGPEAQGPIYSKEYIAFTDLRDVFEGAKWKLTANLD